MTPEQGGRRRRVPLADRAAWEQAVSGVPHTWAHTWEHCAAFARADQDCLLYVWERDGAVLVCPVAVRHGDGAQDVTTPYGFAGPASRGDCTGWRDDWRALAAAEGWVSGYLGLNPVLPDPPGVSDEDVHRGAPLYLLDLDAGLETLLARMSASRRRQLRRWSHDRPVLVTDRESLLDFVLDRSARFFSERGAGRVYDFPETTWRRLLESPAVQAVGAEHDGEVVAAYLFGTTSRCADYLFGFTAHGFEHLSAGLVWEAATVLASAGVPVLNLGGGITPGDGVATFKQRFGGAPVPLRSLREVYDVDRYRQLCAAAGVAPEDQQGFFPPYRGRARA